MALRYPFYGAMSTAFSSTGGNVSALSGLLDDPREITITAPMHPGNSGGPLLGPDGAVIGVVVSTLNKILRLTLVSPDMVEAILDGRQSAALQLDDLLVGFPLDWEGPGRDLHLARPSTAGKDAAVARRHRHG